MLRRSSLFCFVAILGLTYAVTKEHIVDSISVCRRNSPDFESCLKDRLEPLMLEIRKTGLPEFGIESAEPFEIPELLVQYKNGNFSVDLKITDSKSWVSEDFEISAIRADMNDPKRFNMEVDFSIPKMYSEGNFKVDASLLIPIRTKGYYNISMNEIKATAELHGEHYDKDGENYVKIKTFSVLPEVGDMKLYVSDLFPGNEELSKSALEFGNRNWRLFYKQLLPFTNREWGSHAVTILNKVFTTIPFNKLFPLE